jgi:hypothetical protein
MFTTVVLSLALFAPALAGAQEPATNLKDLQSSLDAGNTVRLIEPDGTRVQGHVIDVTSSALKLKVKGVSREFQEPQIREINLKYHDPVWNGVSWGLVIGGTSGAVIGAIASGAFCDGCANGVAKSVVAFGLMGAGIGAGTGGLSDFLRNGYIPVYKAPKTVDKEFGVSPLLSKKTKGVAVAFRF